MDVAVRIDGMDGVMRDLDRFPINADKVVQKAMRKGGAAAARHLRRRTPQQWRRLVGSKVYTRTADAVICLVGLFAKKGRRGDRDGEVPAWYRAYWACYGTLSRRDPSHRFVRPRKSVSRSWRGGVRPQRFYDAEVDGMAREYDTEMAREYNRLITKVYGNGR